MVQNKQKSNKINITAIITCFMLIMVFVFGCVTFAHAEVTNSYIYGEDAFNYANSSEQHKFILCFRNNDSYITWFITNYTDRVALIKREDNCICYFDLYTNPFSNNVKVLSVSSYPKDNNFKTGVGSAYSFESSIKGLSGLTFDSYGVSNGDIVSVGVPVFSNIDDLNTYIQTGEINNPIYQPKEDIEFDSDIEVPLNLDIRLNGNSDFVPNVKISCNQTEQIENRYLEVQYSIGYKATWRLLGGIGLNIKSKTSPTVYGSIEQLEDSFDNGGTSFETILSLSKLSHSVAPDEEAFSKYEPTPKVYWSLKEIKNDNSEMKIWCRNRVGNKASKWIMVSGDGYKANFDVVDSDENGNPTDMKDDTANSETGYGSDYWNNRDNTPQEDYSSTDVKNNLKDLKNNYTSLANFFKELFGFLPAEIWIILIGLVATMALIAILIFVRG